jgi:hypothetical protein
MFDQEDPLEAFGGQLRSRRRQELNGRTRGRLLETLGPTVDRVAVYSQQLSCP